MPGRSFLDRCPDGFLHDCPRLNLAPRWHDARSQLVGQTLREGAELLLQRVDGATVPCACHAQPLGGRPEHPSQRRGVPRQSAICSWDTPLSFSAVPPSPSGEASGAPHGACLDCFDQHTVGRLRATLELGLYGSQQECEALRIDRPSVILLSGPPGAAPSPSQAPSSALARSSCEGSS